MPRPVARTKDHSIISSSANVNILPKKSGWNGRAILPTAVNEEYAFARAMREKKAAAFPRQHPAAVVSMSTKKAPEAIGTTLVSSPATEKVRSLITRATAAYKQAGLSGSLDDHFGTQGPLKGWKSYYHSQDKESLQGALNYRDLCKMIAASELKIAAVDESIDDLVKIRANEMTDQLNRETQGRSQSLCVLDLYQFVEKQRKTFRSNEMVELNCKGYNVYLYPDGDIFVELPYLIDFGGKKEVYFGIAYNSNSIVAFNRLNLEFLSQNAHVFLEQEVAILDRLPPHKNLLNLIKVIREGKIVVGWIAPYFSGRDAVNNLFFLSYHLNLLFDIVVGLVHMHSCEVAHLDVKLDNLLIESVSSEGGVRYRRVILADFDGSLTYEQLGLPSSRLGGSAAYVAPEIFRNRRDCPEKCDIYSLGKTLAVLMGLNYGAINQQDYFGISELECGSSLSLDDPLHMLISMLREDPSNRITFEQMKEQWSTFDWTRQVNWKNVSFKKMTGRRVSYSEILRGYFKRRSRKSISMDLFKPINRK